MKEGGKLELDHCTSMESVELRVFQLLKRKNIKLDMGYDCTKLMQPPIEVLGDAENVDVQACIRWWEEVNLHATCWADCRG